METGTPTASVKKKKITEMYLPSFLDSQQKRWGILEMSDNKL